jgi:hypothetical protein
MSNGFKANNIYILIKSGNSYWIVGHNSLKLKANRHKHMWLNL